jgi:hypothetical protein
MQRVANDLQNRHEVIVADDGEGQDQVGGDQDVHDDAALVALFGGEEVAGKLLDGGLRTVGVFRGSRTGI